MLRLVCDERFLRARHLGRIALVVQRSQVAHRHHGVGVFVAERSPPDVQQLLSQLPRAGDVGVVFRTEFDTSIPCALNPLGVKGVGELGTIGATPAVMNAVIDALAEAGLGRRAEALEMPATPASHRWCRARRRP